MAQIGSDLVQNTPSGWPPQVERILYPIHAFFGPSGVPERLYLFNGLLGAPRGGSKVQKWVSDIYFVNIGHLDHHVVFGTKLGIVQDFQRGKKGPIWVQQNPLDLP